MKLENLNILVTGSTGNLGPLLTDYLVERNANVVGTYFHDESKSNAESRAENFDKVFYYKINLTKRDELFDFRKVVEEKFGTLNCIVNLVGGFKASRLENTNLDKLRGSFDRHVGTIFMTVKAFLDHLEKDGRSIVNFTSQRALEPSSGAIYYNVAKGAVYILTKALNRDLEETRVNAIAPLTIDVPANREAMPEASFDRWTKPEDIVDTIDYLLTNDSINGQIIRI